MHMLQLMLLGVLDGLYGCQSRGHRRRLRAGDGGGDGDFKSAGNNNNNNKDPLMNKVQGEIHLICILLI